MRFHGLAKLPPARPREVAAVTRARGEAPHRSKRCSRARRPGSEAPRWRRARRWISAIGSRKGGVQALPPSGFGPRPRAGEAARREALARTELRPGDLGLASPPASPLAPAEARTEPATRSDGRYTAAPCSCRRREVRAQGLWREPSCCCRAKRSR